MSVQRMPREDASGRRAKDMCRRSSASLLFLSILTIISCAVPVSRGEPADGTLDDRWFEVRLNNSVLHYLHHTVRRQERQGQSVVMTSDWVTTSLPRGGQNGAVESITEFVETTEGRPVSFRYVRTKGGQRLCQEGVIENGKIKLTASSGDHRERREADWDSRTLFPWGLKQLQRDKGMEGGTEYTVETLSPEIDVAGPVKMTLRILGKEALIIQGKSCDLIKVETTLAARPNIVIHTWCDEEWRMEQSEIHLGAVFLRVTRVEGNEAPKEDHLVDSLSFGEVPAVIDRANQKTLTQGAKITLSLKNSSASLSLVEGPALKVIGREGSQAVLHTCCPSMNERSYPIPCSDPAFRDYLCDNVYLQKNNELIRRLGQEAVQDEKDACEAAKRISRYVHEIIRVKTIRPGLIPAPQVAQERKGDCTEHSILCAALARSVGIPSRLVIGLMWGNAESFGFHMWTEMYVGQWMAVDAVLGQDCADGLHIGVALMTLNNNEDRIAVLQQICGTIGEIQQITVEVLPAPFDSTP